MFKSISAVERKGHANQEGDSHTKVTGILLGKLKSNYPFRRETNVGVAQA